MGCKLTVHCICLAVKSDLPPIPGSSHVVGKYHSGWAHYYLLQEHFISFLTANTVTDMIRLALGIPYLLFKAFIYKKKVI